jgi:Family of unknown function (DUF5906)
MSVHYLKPDDDHREARMELLKSQVKNLDEPKLLEFISQLETSWCLNCKGDRWIPITNGFKQFYNEVELDTCGLPRDLDMERISDQHTRKQRALGEMYHHAVALGIAEKDSTDINGNEFQISTRINRLIDMADDAYETVFRYARQYERINHPTLVTSDPDSDNKLFRCTTMDLEGMSPFQELLLALLNETYLKNIRKYKGQCCKQIVTADGFHTKAWKTLMPIDEFVYTYAQKETRFEVWKNLTSRGSAAREAIKFLTDCKDMQFPEIRKNRNVWSFNNGLFVGKEWSTKLGQYICRFYPYESNEFRCLDPTIVSAKYFDKNFHHFEHVEDWWDIPTPHFQSVLEYQKFDTSVSKWMYVMGGKMCFDVGDIDSWQIIPFLKGIAGSGKSTLITKVFKKFYESDDVRTLSNNVERKFGLSSIYDGFMFIAPEVKGDLCLEQAEFQSLVSGEDISIACKYEKAKSVEWKTPGILGGNEVPNWKDNSGSVLRRMLPWNFSKKVLQADPHLDEKLDKELPAILLKCIRAYLDYAQKYSDQDIWNVIPAYFKTIQTQVAMVTNSLQNFLASEKLRYGPDLFCPQKIFVSVFNQHCQENNLGKFKFNPDFYAGPFGSKQLEVRTEARTYRGCVYPVQPIIFGVDVIEEGLQVNNDY